MISLSKKRISFISKIGLSILAIYTLGFIATKGIQVYKNKIEKERIEKAFIEKTKEIENTKTRIILSKKKIKDTENKYIKKPELEKKIKDIYKRMSILDYDLKYIYSKKMCIDKHIIITQLTSKSENGLKAGLGILSYLGEVKQHEKHDSIYFINYISKAKGE